MNKSYKPIDNREYLNFEAKYCEHCTRENIEIDIFCDINTKGFLLKINDKNYPQEWIYDSNGNPTCTSFSVKG